jgi:hypothetical protein
MVCLVEAIAATAIRDRLGLGGRHCDSRLVLFHLSNYLVLRRIALALNRNRCRRRRRYELTSVLWAQIAKHYANNPFVWFGFMNEPHQQTSLAWVNAANAITGGHSCDRRQQTRLSSRQLKTLKAYLLRLTGRVCRAPVAPS